MDHAIYALKEFYFIELDFVKEERGSGKFGKLSDCPSYDSAKALVNAIHTLERYYYGKILTLNVRDSINFKF